VFKAIKSSRKTMNELGYTLSKSTPNQNFCSTVVAIQTTGSSVVHLQQIYYNELAITEYVSHTEGIQNEQR
jgi:hypothetical protein